MTVVHARMIVTAAPEIGRDLPVLLSKQPPVRVFDGQVLAFDIARSAFRRGTRSGFRRP
jgi:hypothetical protein